MSVREIIDVLFWPVVLFNGCLLAVVYVVGLLTIAKYLLGA